MIKENELNYKDNTIESNESFQKIKNIATRSILIAGVGLSLLSHQDLQPKTVYAHSPYRSANIIEKPSKKKINADKYESMNIPNDTIEKQDLFGNNIVITIDDCYNHGHTKKLFETLRENNATATFFPNTMYLNKNNQESVKLWKDIYNAGFEIGYHTTNHEGNMSVEELQDDFHTFTNYMRDFLGEPNFSIKTARPPYGTWDENWNSWIKQNDLLNVRWNMGPSSSANYANVLIEQNTSPLVILHARENDTYWLKENIEKLTDIARQNNSTVGSVYDSLEEMAPTIPTQYDPIEYPFRGIDKVEIK